jgi:hypothetical protein
MISLLLIALLASACGTPTPRPQSFVQTPQAAALTSPLPTPAVIATPSKPDRATITGILLAGSDPRPVAGAILYLARLHQSDGTPAVASYDRVASPRTQTDASGRFVFVDVAVERYGLVLDRIDLAYLLKNPKDDSDFLFEAKPGRVLDLGSLTYSSLPGSNP